MYFYVVIKGTFKSFTTLQLGNYSIKNNIDLSH